MSNQSQKVTLSDAIVKMIADRDALVAAYVANVNPETGETASDGGYRMTLSKKIGPADRAITDAIVDAHGIDGLIASGFTVWTKPATASKKVAKTDDELIAALSAAIAKRDALPESFRPAFDAPVRDALRRCKGSKTLKVTGEKVEKVAAA